MLQGVPGFPMVGRSRIRITRSRSCSRLCVAAVLAGMRWFTAIVEWVADVPAEWPVRLGKLPVGALYLSGRRDVTLKN